MIIQSINLLIDTLSSDSFWGPPNLQSNGYWGFLCMDKVVGL